MTHMSNKSNNGTNNPASNKSRRGPKPIMTIAQIRESMLRELMIKEVKKIEKKRARIERKKNKAHAVAAACLKQLNELDTILADYKKEIPIA